MYHLWDDKKDKDFTWGKDFTYLSPGIWSFIKHLFFFWNWPIIYLLRNTFSNSEPKLLLHGPFFKFKILKILKSWVVLLLKIPSGNWYQFLWDTSIMQSSQVKQSQQTTVSLNKMGVSVMLIQNASPVTWVCGKLINPSSSCDLGNCFLFWYCDFCSLLCWQSANCLCNPWPMVILWFYMLHSGVRTTARVDIDKVAVSQRFMI